VTSKIVVEQRAGSSGVIRPGREGVTLPADLQHEQSVRLQLLYATGTVLWLLTIGMDRWLAPHGDRGPYLLLIGGLAAACAALTALFVRYGGWSHRLTVDLGTLAIVPHALAIAMLNSWLPQPTTTRPLSSTTVLILFVGMLASARPWKVLATGVLAASMDPLAVWFAHLRGLPVPAPLYTLLLFYENYVCAVLAIVPARVVYQLGGRIREARELGSYRLVERLGQGGMGEVWLARHRLLARTAAIKLIRPEVLTTGGADRVAVTVARFEREARATAALTSPHTIRLYDYGLTEQGACYYVMELLDGRDLDDLVRQFGPLPPARVLHLLRQMCASLGEAHAAGLIHRDVTPANVYVCRMGLEYDFVKVLDFGLVRHEDRAVSPTLLTHNAAIVGTPAYMAPEAILGDAVDRRADVYALGCVAYFLLTGQPVFGHDSTMRQLVRHVHDTPEPPSRRAPHRVPRALDDLVMACLQKDPAARPDSAEVVFEMAAACFMRDPWDRATARRWWETHLCANPTPDAPVPARLVTTLAAS
jgi:eukaryotic-like serine/threonine-protein kinase